MAQENVKTFDIVVFGATGFTGKRVVKELARLSDEIKNIKWSVAGRNRDKLRNVLDWASADTGKDLSNIEIVQADVSDEASLASMCKNARLILNLVGPYHFYGEAVVKACVENGCHHMDISGEMQWLERMALEYHEKAKAAGVYIIEACGFDSIPADMGVLFTKKEFPGILNSVESYLTFHSGPAGSKFNFGTLHSLIHAIANFRELKRVQRQLNRQPLPKFVPKLSMRNRIFHSSDNDTWSAPFPGTDVLMVERSQRYLYEKQKERPIQYGAYICRGGFFSLFFLAIGVGFLGLLALCRCGRRLLSKYPEFFTMGMFGHEGPTQEQMDGTTFQFNFYGRGFSSEKAEKLGKPDIKIVTRCTGPEMAYVATPIAMVQAGLTLLQEKDQLPADGGVYTPGAAFYDTTLIQRCDEHGIRFSVEKVAEKY